MTFPRLLLPLLLIPCLAAACASTEEGEMSDEQKLEYYGGNAERYIKLKEYERAQDQVQRALEVDPDEPRLHLMLGLILLKRGGTEDILGAESVLRGQLGSDDFRVAMWLGTALERKGFLHDEAAREIESGERYTEHPDPEERAAELRKIARESWEESLERYAQASEQFGEERTNREILSGQSRVQALLGQREASLASARKLLESVETQSAHYRKQLDRVDIHAEEARLRRALENEEELEAELLLHTSSLATTLGELEVAAEDLTRLIQLRPLQPEAHSRRGEVLAKLGRYEEAVYSLDKFMTLSPLDFSHPSITRAAGLREECQRKIREAATASKR